ncbi:MAG: hypothetical protein WBC53_00350, partial [Phycisphaerae bacterium]
MILPTRQRRIALAITMVLGAMLVALAGRLLYIERCSSERLASRAAEQHHMRVTIRPMRGNILDARLRVLATSVEVQSVFADLKVIRDTGAAAAKAAPVLGMDADELYETL